MNKFHWFIIWIFFSANFNYFVSCYSFNNSSPVVGNPTQVPLAFYYDYFASRDAYTNSLAVPPGVETVFGGNNGNTPISISGSATSIRLNPSDLCNDGLSCFTYDNVIYWLNMFTYVHIDEISYNHPCPECASVIEQVGNTPGYKGRIIPFFRYSTSGSGLESQKKVIELGMNGYLRKIFFEVYPSNHDGCSSYICTSTSGSACDKLKQWEVVFGNNYQGSNILMSPAYGLRQGVDLDQCSHDIDALTSYFSCMHANDPLTNWKGAAFFGSSACTGCSSYTVQTMASHCGNLLKWWQGK